MIHVIEHIVAKENRREDLKKALLDIVPLCRNEPGCLMYDLYHDREKPDAFYVIMQWENESYYENHLETSA